MTGVIVWRGTSRLDHKTPVVVALTGLATGSHNRKTGDMVQSWILVDDGRRPSESIRDGADAGICGKCPHRGDHGEGRTCYVSLATGLSAVSRALPRYSAMAPQEASEALRGRALRLGAYGDPAAAPVALWRQLTAHVRTWTGYTHQWRRRPALKSLCMASVDSDAERREATELGWRTFRVRQVRPAIEPLATGEVMCPASHEAGKRVTCSDCSLCQGTRKRARSVAIIDHSTSALWARGLHRSRKLQVIQ